MVFLLCVSLVLLGGQTPETEPGGWTQTIRKSTATETSATEQLHPGQGRIELLETDANEPNQGQADISEPVEGAGNHEGEPPAESAESVPDEVSIVSADVNEGQTITPEPNQPAKEPDQPNLPEPNQVEPVEVEMGQSEPNEPKAEGSGRQTVEVNEPPPEKATANAFHQKCGYILGEYVTEDGNVDYETLRRKRLELKTLVDEFDELPRSVYESWTKQDKIAFWLNAYNIEILYVIIQNYPIESSPLLRLFWPPTSIRHIEGIWTEYKFIIMDEEFTLSEIEHRYFRGRFDEPRVFFAICNASRGSPPLRNEPYCGAKLDEQLDDQVRRFLSGSEGFRIDWEGRKVYLSAIFQPSYFGKEFIPEFGTDKKFKSFNASERAVLNFITRYVSQQEVHYLEVGNYSIEYIKYDWRLNQ